MHDPDVLPPDHDLDKPSVLLVHRIHVSRMGGEVWRLQTRQGHSFSEFESGDKDLIVKAVEVEVADVKLLLNPETHQLTPWPQDATRQLLDQWVHPPQPEY